MPETIPTPGLRGDYRGSCVVCMRSTDTAFGIRGEAEASIAALVVLGVNQEEAYEMLRAYWAEAEPDNPLEPGNVPGGVHDWAFRACREHAGPFVVGLIPNIPFVDLD